MAFDLKQFLDFEGLSTYDELIKKFIKDNNNNTESNMLAQLEALGEKVQQNIDAIEILNGDADVEGSVAQQVNDAVAKVVDAAPEMFDTLKEIADWIADDETGAANLVNRVADLEDADVEIKEEIEDLREYVDTQDNAVYNSIQSIEDFKIVSLFPAMQGEDETVMDAINNLEEGTALKLVADQVVEEDIVLDKSCYIDANGATFAGQVIVPADKEIVIVNATFNQPVVMA